MGTKQRQTIMTAIQIKDWTIHVVFLLTLSSLLFHWSHKTLKAIQSNSPCILPTFHFFHCRQSRSICFLLLQCQCIHNYLYFKFVVKIPPNNSSAGRAPSANGGKVILDKKCLYLKLLSKHISQRLFIPIGHRSSRVWIDLLEVTLQCIEESRQQEQLLPRILLMHQQVSQERIHLASTERFSPLDSRLCVTTHMGFTQTTCCVASVTIQQPFGKSQNRWGFHESCHVT